MSRTRLGAVLLGIFALTPNLVTAADVPAFTMTTAPVHDTDDPSHYSIGYIFTTSASEQVAGLGALDFGGTTIGTTSGFPVQLYYSTNPPSVGTDLGGGHFSADPVVGFSGIVTGSSPILSTSGGSYTAGQDGFRYDIFSSPLTLPAGTYELVVANQGTLSDFSSNPTGFAEASGFSLSSGSVYFVTGTNAAIYAGTHSSVLYAFGPNLLVVQTPEPATWVLILIGLLGSWKLRKHL